MSAIRIRGVVEVKEGKSEEFRQACRELVEAVREGEPDTVSYGTMEVYGKPTPELMAALDGFEISMTFYSGVATKD